jgi:hypothetical protein
MSGQTNHAAGFGGNNLMSLFAKEHLVPDFINEECSADASWKLLIGSNYMDKLKAGDILRFLKFDGAFEIVDKELNGTRRYQDLGDADSICAQMCSPREIPVKRNVSCVYSGGQNDMMAQVYNMQMANTMKRFNQQMYRKVINMIMSGTDSSNKGLNAGAMTHNIGLGTTSAPLFIDVSSSATADSVRRQFVDVFGNLKDVVDQQDLSDCGACDWSYKLSEQVVSKLRYAVGDGSCCNWNEKISMNQVDMYGDFLGSSVLAASGSLMPVIAKPDGFLTPVIYSCPQVGHFAAGVCGATMDAEHDDETTIVTVTDGGVIVRPRLAAYAWVFVKTK